MKYLKSTSSKAYQINGYTIPPNTGTSWLQLPNDKAIELERIPVIKGLIQAGSILITDKEPSELSRTPGKLLNANNALANENAALKAELEKLKAEKEAALQGNEAAQALAAAQEEAAALKAELEKQKAAYASLENEAKETIASLQGQSSSKGKKKTEE